MKIAVVGAGGIGAYYGAVLAKAGADVHFLVTQRHVAPIRERGIVVTTDEGDYTVHPASVGVDAAPVGVADVVIVTVKLYQLESTLPTVRALTGPGTIVVTLQNGVTAGPRLQAALGDGHVVPGLATIVTFLLEPGHVKQVGGRPGLEVAAQPLGTAGPGVHRHVGKLVDLLVAGGVGAGVAPDIDRALWTKFALITTFGGVGGLAHATIGETRSFAPTRHLLEASLREVQAVAAARGVTVSDDDLAGVLAKLDSLPAESTSSMQRDLAAGHASELEDLNGTVVKLGAQALVPTPLQSVIYAVLSLHQQRGRV